MMALMRQTGGVAAEHFKDGAWFEDFTGGAIPSGWSAYQGHPLVYPSDSWMLAANVGVSGTTARITTKLESSNGMAYTSGRLTTQGRRTVRYGLIEVNARIPFTRGVWTEMWMQPRGQIYGLEATWAGGEIDIMENPGPGAGFSNQQFATTLHYGGPGDVSSGQTNSAGVDLSAAFHTYAVLWEPSRFTFSVDGVSKFVVNGGWYSAGGAYPAPFDQHFYLRLDAVVGTAGSWSLAPDGTTILPTYLDIDWVRYTPL